MHGLSYGAVDWVPVVLLMSSCASNRVVPGELEPLVDRAGAFREVIGAPESHQGRILVVIVNHRHIWQEASPGYVRPLPGFSSGIFGGAGRRIGGGLGVGL